MLWSCLYPIQKHLAWLLCSGIVHGRLVAARGASHKHSANPVELQMLFSLQAAGKGDEQTVYKTFLTPEGLWCCIGLENIFPVFLPHRGFLVFRILQHHRLSHNRVVRLFMPPIGARPKGAKINVCLAYLFFWCQCEISKSNDNDNNNVT